MKGILICLFINVILLAPAMAGTVYKTGKVTSVKMFGSVVVVYVDTISEKACSSGQKRVAIKSDDPIFSAVVSTALAAKATDATVEIGYDDQCTHNSNSWDFESFWLQ